VILQELFYRLLRCVVFAFEQIQKVFMRRLHRSRFHTWRKLQYQNLVRTKKFADQFKINGTGAQFLMIPVIPDDIMDVESRQSIIVYRQKVHL